MDLRSRWDRYLTVISLSLAIAAMASCQGLSRGGSSNTTTSGVGPGSLTASPVSLNFGSVTVGRTQSQNGTITNSAGTSVTVSQAITTGAGFSVSGLTLPLTLSPGQSAAFTATFTPATTGNLSGNIAFGSNVATLNVPLAGSGLAVGSLGASPASVNFGNVQVGSTQTQTITLTNGSSSTVTVSRASASGTGFTVTGLSLPVTLAVGQSTAFTAAFAPNSAGSVTGGVAITSDASNTLLNIVLSGTGVTAGTLAVNPASINFGSVQVGSGLSRSETMTNSGGSSISVSAATITGAGFSTSGLNLPATLNAGQSLTFNVTFAPQAPGSASGTISLTTTGSVPSVSVSLSATATAAGQLAVAPATVNFGNVTVGANQNQTVTLTASGASVTISSVGTSSLEFAVKGLSLPLILSAGQSASFTLTFTPQASGVASGTITFTSNATNPSVAESVTGTGTPTPQHSVSLSWGASTSTVVGYKVYRGTQSGGPYAAITSAPDASTAYTDSTVLAGGTYYYVVTAVDSSANESVYSNQAQAVIPTP
jgi:hypothetical protein